MNVAAVQLTAEESVEANVERAVSRVRDAAKRGAELVVLPEMWNVGYFAFDAYDDAAEPLDGPTATRLAELADELDIHLHGGSIVERDGDDLYNTSLLFDPAGERIASYRKIHLFGYESEESTILTPGEEVCAVETDLGTVGLTTCYDLRFPELYRQLVERGVELLLVTSAWPAARSDHWHLLTRTRAVENQLFLVAANLTGTNRGVELGGQSVVVDPWGIQRANAGNGDRTVTAEIDRETVEEVRAEFPALHDRRFRGDYTIDE
ncbi:carbon-nitrogen family hydrolase [Halogeometricum borinquense]|uniref:Carbon-nitrogen family hydrolase n=1 Tax=Halogeometricum borinquense TaxID=60847 RepID=A0A482TGJ4_9EURY|nr:carbon-nitrogen family hydrolase [Halogeometricum borinquense]RYJ19568.1 carbon-nitrogen family hydrolase [Halogeometricum borinquense]